MSTPFPQPAPLPSWEHLLEFPLPGPLARTNMDSGILAPREESTAARGRLASDPAPEQLLAVVRLRSAVERSTVPRVESLHCETGLTIAVAPLAGQTWLRLRGPLASPRLVRLQAAVAGFRQPHWRRWAMFRAEQSEAVADAWLDFWEGPVSQTHQLIVEAVHAPCAIESAELGLLLQAFLEETQDDRPGCRAAGRAWHEWAHLAAGGLPACSPLSPVLREIRNRAGMSPPSSL